MTGKDVQGQHYERRFHIQEMALTYMRNKCTSRISSRYVRHTLVTARMKRLSTPIRPPTTTVIHNKYYIPLSPIVICIHVLMSYFYPRSIPLHLLSFHPPLHPKNVHCKLHPLPAKPLLHLHKIYPKKASQSVESVSLVSSRPSDCAHGPFPCNLEGKGDADEYTCFAGGEYVYDLWDVLVGFETV